MTNIIPANILSIYKKIKDKGFEVYLVGGCVRDMLLKREVKDWDLTTNATPEDILKIFKDAFYDNQFGTVGISVDQKTKKITEVTTFRKEESYTPTHRPEKVSWGKTLEDDLSRRDFTINAIALRLKNGDFDIIDPFKGQEDLKNKIVRAVGNPSQRFKEDALRLIRGVRIATELEFSIEDATWKEIINDSSLISHISKERIRTELLRILKSDHAYEGIMLLKESNLLMYIIPELLEGVGVSQERPGRHHKTDVFTHNVLSLKFCTSIDPIVKFATLIHDVGKPRAAKKDEENLVIFHNHEVVGAKMAKEICERLKFSKKEKDKIVNLVRWHMFTIDEGITDSAVRRFIRRVGGENVKDMMDLRVGDRLGGGTQVAESWRLKLFKKRIEEQLKPGPFSINDLAIDGNDVMKELSIKPGPKVGKILQKIFEEVDEDLSKNSKEWLLGRVRKTGKMDIKNL